MTSWILYWRRGRNGALRHFLQHVVAADGFDDFFLGVFLVVVFVVVLLVARRASACRSVLVAAAMRGVIRSSRAMFGVTRIVGMGCVFGACSSCGALGRGRPRRKARRAAVLATDASTAAAIGSA